MEVVGDAVVVGKVVIKVVLAVVEGGVVAKFVLVVVISRVSFFELIFKSLELEFTLAELMLERTEETVELSSTPDSSEDTRSFEFA